MGALAAAPGPDLVSSLPGNKGAPLPPSQPNHSQRNEKGRKIKWNVKRREYGNDEFKRGR